MRIVSGTHKGRRIIAPRKLPVRPTTDMAKEALFNILRNHYRFSQISVLDLFAGTGNISYEFGSRGCELITAVDADAACARFIQTTATSLNMPIETFKSDVFKFLERTANKYDLVFADPPYDLDDAQFGQIVSLTFSQDLLNEDGMLVIEHSKHTDLSAMTGHQETRKYGGSAFSFFQ